MATTPIDEVLNELAATANYLRENGKLMREAVTHLIETEGKLIETERLIEKHNRYAQLVVEHIEKAKSTKDDDT